MKAVHKTHKGRVRETNEDFYYVSDDLSLFVLADGMGGHLAGEMASRLAVEVVVDEMKKSFETETELEELIKSSVSKANEVVYNKSVEDINLRGMGTTLSLVCVYKDNLYYTNIGDSRIYKIDDEMEQITKDDSFVNYLVELGEITPEEAKVHPKKNVITRAIGTAQLVVPEVQKIKLDGGEILMCSDGLTNMVSDEEIFKTIRETKFDSLSDVLVEKALEAGGIDNITLIVIGIE